MGRGKDFETISKATVDYYSSYGKLVLRDVSEADLLAGNCDDPLEGVTYFVLRVGTNGTKIDPMFNANASGAGVYAEATIMNAEASVVRIESGGTVLGSGFGIGDDW